MCRAESAAAQSSPVLRRHSAWEDLAWDQTTDVDYLTHPIAGATGSSYATPALTSSIVASGKSLTVTTANAVATFSGADLVGFVNSLTGESYLKKPSGGDLTVVDTIAYTGQSLQASNWAVGVEPGTGLPLATITSHDSVRTFTMTVKVDPASQEIVLRSSAGASSPGVRGASWSMAGLNLATGRWIVPGNAGVAFDRAHPGLDATLQYPYTWQAQMAVYEATLGSFLLYSTDGQYYFKDLRQTSRGDSTLDVAVYTEAVAPFPSAITVPAVEWRLKAFSGDWRVAAQTFRDWMVANRPQVSNAAHPWVSDIRTVVMVSGQDSTVLAPLAAQVNPSRTLLYLVDWRQADYDVNYPDYTPRAGAAGFITAAHALGFKVMLHTDLIGVAPGNPDYAGVQQYQARTPESLQLMGWNWDQPPSTPQRYGIIDPAAAAFRSLWIARIGAAVTALGPDALHLDFTAMYNDGNGPIEGRTYPQGEDLLNQQIIAAFPGLALGSEEETDFTYRYHSFAQAGWWGFAAPGHPIVGFLFAPQVEYYGHLATPPVSDPAFKSTLIQQMQRAVFPMWYVWSSYDLDTGNVDNARFIGMVQSWQGHAFQPAWTADWTGALVRYEGTSGSTAVLTDTSTLMTLTASGAQLFQMAHDANQATTSSFVPFWPAFDDASLFGLDPGKLYLLDPTPRPTTTHVTSLPAGVRLGPGTLVAPAFAHVELAAPVASSFDFQGGLFAARSGVRFQGIDTPLGNGAVVSPRGITAGGVTRSGIAIQPPYQGQVGGETFVEYPVPVPAGATMQFSVGIDDGAACTDGVTFRVTADGLELWSQSVSRGAWQDVLLDLAAYGGSTVALRLISHPGPSNNPSCDWALWSQLSLGATATPPPISVPMSLASGSVVSGFDGDGVLSGPPLTPTVTNVPLPGAFTVFTRVGTAVSNGTNLANLPFDVWRAAHGELAVPGGMFGAGAVGGATSGGVTKTQTIWAHPPDDGTTMLSWVLRLPEVSALGLGFSVGLGDGAASVDGVDFQVRVNGVTYWHLTTQADRWLPGALDLTRWKGQNVLVELVTASRANNNWDWAYWADLVLSTSTTTCSYGVPSAASVGATGGSFSVNVTATATCSWAAVSHAPWLTIASGSGSGNGTVSYGAAPNAGPPRKGVLTIAGQAFTVTQSAVDGTSLPTVTVQPQGQLLAPGDAANLSVTATGTEPLTYQWYVGASGTTTNPIGGATGRSYTTPALTSTTSYWVRVENAFGTADSTTATILVATPTLFYTVTPCRLVDTRAADGPALAGGTSRTFVLTGKCDLPATAKAVSVNVTVTQPTSPGNLRLYPGGTTLPLVSAINYSPGQTRANNAVVALGAAGDLAVRCGQAAGSSTHFILDVNGYFE
jgi:hypothetical protein